MPRPPESFRATEMNDRCAGLFPLPFTPFEYYYWCDDRPDSPTTFPIELVFAGLLQREEFERACCLAVARHPLLDAIVDVDSARIPQWVDAAHRAPPINWADFAEPIGPSVIGALDLTSLPGLRVWVRTSPEETRVVFHFHHACCDALGGLQFIEELLVIYDSLVNGSDCHLRLRPLKSDQLIRRGDYGVSASGHRPGLRDVLVTGRIWAATLFRRTSPLLTNERPSDFSVTDERDCSYLTETLSQQDMQHLHAASKQAGTTINDVMLRDLFLVLDRWNREHGGRRRQRPTVNVPVSLRSRFDREMPAANSLGFWFLHRSSADCLRPTALLQSIRDETAAVKKWRLPLYFVAGLEIAARIPGLMRQMLDRKQSFATAVFSNVGRVFAHAPLERRDGQLICGNVILKRVTGVPPIRPGTRISIAVATYGDETTINLRRDPKFLSISDGRQLLSNFREQLMTRATL